MKKSLEGYTKMLEKSSGHATADNVTQTKASVMKRQKVEELTKFIQEMKHMRKFEGYTLVVRRSKEISLDTLQSAILTDAKNKKSVIIQLSTNLV